MSPSLKTAAAIKLAGVQLVPLKQLLADEVRRQAAARAASSPDDVDPARLDHALQRVGVNRYSPEALRVAILKSTDYPEIYAQATKSARSTKEKLLRLKDRRGELLDFDGTIVPEIKGNAAEYRAALAKLTPDDLGPAAREFVGKRVDIVTARPAIFHDDIRATATRLGLEVGDIHDGGFDKTEKIRELGRPLVDNNEEVVSKIHKNLGPEWARLIPTHTKQADSWLQRWLALHAARDAANMQNPNTDAIAAKLGGPLSLGLSEAISNLSMGSSKRERRETLEDAVSEVEDDTYSGAALRGLKSSLPYAIAGGVGGVAHSALTPVKDVWKNGPHWNPRRAAIEGGVGAAAGVGLAVLRPILQKLILDNVSSRAKRKAVAIKADMPMVTSLPLGDMIAAGAHPAA